MMLGTFFVVKNNYICCHFSNTEAIQNITQEAQLLPTVKSK